MKLLLILPALWLGFAAQAETPATRTYYTGHSFTGAPAVWLGILATQAQITGYESLGRQALGALEGQCGHPHPQPEHADAGRGH